MTTEHWGVVVLGQAGDPHPLPQAGRMVLGSSEAHSDLLIDGQGVDEAHCAIGRLQGGGWAVKDLGSRYGTLLNGARVGSGRLSLGDELVLGSRKLQVVDLDNRTEQTPAPAEEQAPAEPDDSRGRSEPERIAGYRLERRIGRGRMGIVFRAVQESLSRSVALKILDPRLAADQDFVRRFRTEAKAAAALNHPNVVIVHDVGEDGGRHFLSMEYVSGGSLEDEVASEGPLSWHKVLDVLHDAAGALDYAEKRGIIHRDVKPDNLMRAAGGTVKLADLGLATTVSAAAGEERVFGTPHFISPEQARGEAVDHRSDLYSLGATAYRLLTGQTPFDGADTREILRAHFSREPRPLREVVPDIPAEVEALVLRLLAKDPDARPESARVVLDEVDRMRAASAAAHWTSGDPQAQATTKRILGTLGLGILGAVGLLFVLILAARKIAPSEDDVPSEGSEVAEGRPLDTGNEEDPFFDPQDGSEDPFRGVESRLKELDRQADERLSALAPDLTSEERLAELRSIAKRFPGTETAGRIEARIQLLLEEQRLAEERAAVLETEATRAVQGLRGAVGWSPADDPRTLREVLAAVRAYRPPSGVSDHVIFDEAREVLQNEIAAHAFETVQNTLGEADRLSERGDFDGVAGLLTALIENYTPPKFVGGEPLPFAKTRLLLEEAERRSKTLGVDRARWGRIALERDHGRVARALGAGSTYAEELRDLDWAAMETRLDSLVDEVRSEAGQTFAQALLMETRSAKQALDILLEEYGRAGWRRQSIIDVRDGRGTATVIGVNADGLRLEGSADRLTPWSSFAADTEWMHQLFHERLTRPYSPEERVAVAAIIRLVAVNNTAARAREALRAETSELPTLADLQAPLDLVSLWIDDTGSGDSSPPALSLAGERNSVETFLIAGAAARDGSWSQARALTEALLDELLNSLFVTLLADGTQWTENEPR